MDNNIISEEELTALLATINRNEEAYQHTINSEKRHALLFAPYNISFNEYRILAYLMIHPDESEPSRIADYLMILRQTMTILLDGLQKRGFVERIPHPNDRRRVCIGLLPEGRELILRLLCLERDYTLRLRSHFSPEEVKLYHELSARMAAAKISELEIILAERNEK